MSQQEKSDPQPWGWWFGVVIVGLVIVGALLFMLFRQSQTIQQKTEGLMLVHLGSGKMMADGSEQRLFTFEASQPFTFDGWVNLKELQAEDKVTLTQYAKLGIENEYGKYESAEYVGLQDKPMVFIRPKNALYGIMITLQQTQGPFRSFEWEFYKGVTS